MSCGVYECVASAVVVVLLYLLLDYIWHRELLSSKDRAVFITGCDSGFGRALAERLDSLGCQVFAACFTEKGIAELSNGFHNVHPLQLDVTNTDSIVEAYNKVKHILQGKQLWGVVNNAGISGTGGPIEFIFRKELLNTFNINMASMAEVGRVFLPLLKESRGRLVNMVSMAGRVGMYNMGQYSASKFAMEGYSDCQRRELDPWGISVSIINPGYFRTAINNPEQLRKEKEAQWELVSEEVREGYPEYAKRSVAYAENLLTKVMSESVYKVQSCGCLRARTVR